jgi:2-(1,2-epoxy-1,2-dihydrophenyl)acetyl-CoA isomerase
LTEAFRAVAKDDAIRAVVLTGAGRAFSSGQDLAELQTQYKPGFVPVLGKRLRTGYNPLIRVMRELEKPIIGAVNGVAAGAGCSVALACDLRVASEKASFIEVFINVGLVPDSGSTFFLPRLVGMAKAAELCFTGDKVSAEEALRLGIVNRVVAPDVLLQLAQTWAGKLASMPTRAIGLTKRLLNQSMQTDLAGMLEAEAFAQETAGKTADHFEGVTAFLEKRSAQFKGQ